MIVFIGTQESGFFIEEIIQDEEIVFTNDIDINNLENVALHKNYSCSHEFNHG